jgi:2-amino-4-hydroxy-6-hydroxymethyldihydropteridine diphosphokinase
VSSHVAWQPAYVALGSNLEQPELQIEKAFTALTALPDSHFVLRSALYRSAPMGPQDQPDFVNAAAGLLTRLSPQAMLAELHRIEQRMGRERVVHWGPRIIDLDLLLLGEQRVVSDALQLPHPGLLERVFVLLPLAEIAPQLRLPNGQTSVRTLAHMDTKGIERVT